MKITLTRSMQAKKYPQTKFMGRTVISTRTVIVVYRDNFTPYGIFINTHHLQENIGIQNANIGKYLNFKMFTLSKFIAVEAKIGREGITDDLFTRYLDDAKKRQAMADVNRLTIKRLNKLRPDQIIAINKIINE